MKLPATETVYQHIRVTNRNGSRPPPRFYFMCAVEGHLRAETSCREVIRWLRRTYRSLATAELTAAMTEQYSIRPDTVHLEISALDGVIVHKNPLDHVSGVSPSTLRICPCETCRNGRFAMDLP